jgi:hypothetical protein
MTRGRLAGLVGLVIAVLAAGRLLTLPEPAPTAPAASGSAETVQDRWPDVRIVKSPGRLADGRAYTPWYHLDAETSVGTALTSDGVAMRLVVRGPGGAERELLRLPADDNPQFNGFAAAGDELVFMASGGTADSASTLYRASWRAGAASRLTADTGTVVFFNSQYDVVIADGRAHWAAAGSGGQFTEVRSIPLTGGRVTTQKVDGTYALSAWPWLTSAGGSQSGAVELRNLQTGERIAVPGSASELVTCGPVWCRVLLLGAAGQPARTDVMRPTGADRTRMAAGSTSAAVLDVALLDRFEVLSQTVGSDGPSTLTVILYDVPANRSSVLATGVATVQARGPVVWWSTGTDEAVEWFALDLRTLAP